MLNSGPGILCRSPPPPPPAPLFKEEELKENVDKGQDISNAVSSQIRHGLCYYSKNVKSTAVAAEVGDQLRSNIALCPKTRKKMGVQISRASLVGFESLREMSLSSNF